MKVTLVHPAQIPPSLYGGTERVIAWLALALQQLGHSVTVIALPGSNLAGVQIIPLNRETFHEWPKHVPRDTDIVHLRSKPHSTVPFPVLVTLDGNGQPDETFHPNTVFLSKKHAQNHCAEVFVHHGLPFDVRSPTQEAEDYVVFLAKASWSVKNLKGAITVAKSLGVPLKVLGSRSYPLQFQRITQKLAFPVQYYGMVDDAEKKSILSKAKALFFPVRWHEPFGLAAIEALSLGVPVMATPYGSLPEIIDSSCGFLSHSSSEWTRYYNDHIRKGFDRDQCRNRIQNQFDSVSMAQKYLHLYQQVISGKELHSRAPRTLDGFIAQKLLPWT